MKTSSAKAKGRRPLKKLVAEILRRFPHLTADDVRVTPSGVPGEDVQLSPAARECLPFAVEGKNVENLLTTRGWKAVAQADGHRDDYPSVLIFTRNRDKLRVALEAEVFLDMVEELWRLRKERG